MIASSTQMYDVLTIASTGFFVPLIITVVSTAWLIGIATKAMKSNDLV